MEKSGRRTPGATAPSKNHRPWGFFEVLAEGPGHKIKRITINRGERVSLQRHARRHEHWVVVDGRALVTRDGRELLLGAGGTADIPAGTVHRVASDGDRPLVFIEVQRGDYLGEDDIERFEDDYGRIP